MSPPITLQMVSSSRFGDRQHCLGSQTPPRVVWGTKFRVSSGHKTRESIGKVGTLNARVQWQLEFVTAFDCTLEYRKGSATASSIFPARFPEPATEYDRNGLTSFNLVGLTSPKPVGDSGIYLLRTRGLRAPSRRRDIVWLASSSARWARAAEYAKPEGAAWAPRSRELWGWRSVKHGEPR